jgi:DEAD/DEAH box helicase domain-containing protein
VSVTEKVVGFKKVRFYTSENVGFGDVSLPEHTYNTTACWLTLDSDFISRLGRQRSDLVDAIMGASHALFYVSILSLMCDGRDLGRCVGDKSAQWFAMLRGDGRGNYSYREEPAQGSEPVDVFDPTLFFYDAYTGGVGFSPLLFARMDELLERALDLIERCGCQSGCPACIGPSASPGPSKEIAIALLKLLTGKE